MVLSKFADSFRVEALLCTGWGRARNLLGSHVQLVGGLTLRDPSWLSFSTLHMAPPTELIGRNWGRTRQGGRQAEAITEVAGEGWTAEGEGVVACIAPTP